MNAADPNIVDDDDDDHLRFGFLEDLQQTDANGPPLIWLPKGPNSPNPKNPIMDPLFKHNW